MSILAYQEVICRIEELTRCIHELDPYSVMPPPTEEDPAATLAMLVSSGERARQQRRGRSPERRALLPPPPRLARSPAWAPGGTTYAEIVKGCNSRSSSVHERQPSVQRLPMHRMRYETPEMRQTEPVNIEPDEVYSTAIISDVQQCARSEDFVDKSEPIDYHESTYYESECDVPVASDTNVYCEQKPVIDININKKPSVINQKNFQEESVSHLPQDTQNTSTLRPSSAKERSVSPATKYRCQDLSYAEILALGLRKQTSVQNVTILPKPQTAQVEIMTEVVIEEEKMSHNESKLLKDVSLVKQERLEKPVQRSRSRDMPRQRRAPEKRKTSDIQLTKKKKGAKKVIEVENFDDICDSMPTEEVLLSTYKTNVEKPKIIEKPHLENPEGISVVFKNKSVVETEKNKTLVKDTITADEEKKPKKKSKTRKPRESEDDIERALKEIEQSDKQKKKKLKQKMKENDGECLTETVFIKTETISSSQIIKKSDSTVKPKKKKIKEVPLLDPITTSFTDRKEISEQHNDDSTKLFSVKTNASTNPNESNPESMIQDVIYNTIVNIGPEDKTDEKHLTSCITADSSLNYTCPNQSSQKDILSMSENIKSKKKKKDKKQEPSKDSNLQKSGTEIVPSHIKPPVTSIQRNIIENNRNICKVEENSLVIEDNQENLTDNSNIIESPIERDDIKTNQNESEKDDNNASDCDADTSTKVDVSNIDWVKLMEEEEQISLTGNKDSVGCKEIQEVVEQRNNEVLKVLNTANVDETNEDTHVTKLCPQDSDLNLLQTSSSNEQNNNDISNEIKEDSAQITTEISVTENYFPNEKTHTVYLITHEERKLPPIRTVKVFRSKSNSLEEHPISDVDTLTSQLMSEIEELSSSTRPECVPAHQGTASEAAEYKNVEVVEDILLSSTTSATNIGDLEKNDDNVEQAIFGSVQIRKNNISESNIPYTELIDDNNIVIESEANIKDTENPSVLYLLEENSGFSYFELHDAEKRLYSTRAQNDDLNVNVTAEDIKTDTDISKGYLKTGNQLTENVTDSQLDCLQQDKNLRISTERELFEQPYYNYAAIVDAERFYANNVKYSEIPLETCNAQSASSQTDLLLKELRKDISIEESDKKISSEDQHSSLKKHPMIDVKEVPQQNYQDIADAEHLLGCVTTKQEANFVDKVLKESKENINGQTKANVAYEVSKLNYQVIEDAERLLGSLTSSKQNLNSPPSVSEYTVSQKSDNVDDDKSKVICNDEIPKFNYQEICDAEKLFIICNKRDYDSSIEINTKEAEVLSKSGKVPQFEIPIHKNQELIDADKLQAIQNNKNEDKLVLPLEQVNKAEANRKISKMETDIIKDPNSTIEVIDILQKDSPTQHHSEIANVISENVESMQHAESSSSYENIDKPVQLTEPSVESNQQITDVQNEPIIEAMSDKEDDGFVLVEISDSQDQIINDDILESNYIEPVRDTTEVAHETIKVISEPFSKEPTYQLQSKTASSKIQITTNVSDVHQSDVHQEAANDYVIVSESEKVPSTNEVIESNIEDKTDLLCNLNVTADSSTTVKDLAELTSEEQNIITQCSSFNIEKQITTTDATVVNLTQTLLTKEDVSNEESANDYEIINQVENIESINQINIRAQKSESEDNIDSLPSTTSLNPEFSIEPENVVTYDKNEMSATRTEKSPIHSLHDLLPEIDSIPEFKPSYNNKALFSNLSADAPEFKPSYLYHTTETTTFLPEISNADSVINTSEGNTISILTDSKQHSVKSQQEISGEKVNTAIVNIVSDSPQTSDCKTASDAVSKVETKKRKKAEKLSSSHKSEVLPDINIFATPVNVWTKAADEGKSYAKIVAEGLSEFPKIEKKIEDSVKSKTEDSQCEIPLPPPTEEISIEALKHQETSETWAKIVASHLPSPDRLSKVDISVQEVTPIPHKSPIIVVEETENVVCKSEVAVDAEGFITVDRNRRSRSRSRTRDINSPSVSKTPLRTEAREKSINRFDALVDSIVSDDTSDIPNIESNEEKLRKKERESPEKSDDSKDKNVSASHKKRNKSSKSSSSQLSSKKTDTTQKSESNQKEMSVSIESVEKSNAFSTDSQKETQSKKKKNKKKNKDKTVVQSLVDTTAKEEVSVAKDPDIELKVVEEQIQKLISPIGTPESIQTPVKERVYSEAQFWKTSPDIYLELSSASEVISVEVPECSIGTIKGKLISVEDDSNIVISNITHCEESETSMMQDIKLADTKISEEQSLKSNTTNIESEISSMTHHEEPEANKMRKITYTDTKISEEQSLENKMADLQREIEEMLLPENDNSTISEDLPNELMDLDNSINEHQDELLDNMSPSLASPEPEDTLGSQEEIPQFDSMPLPHKKYDSLMAEQGLTLVSSKKDNTLDNKDQLLSSPGNLNESLTVDEHVTNTLSNLLLDSFSFRNFAVEDAANLYAIQKSAAPHTVIDSPIVSVDDNIFKEDQTLRTEKNKITDKLIESSISEKQNDNINKNIFNDQTFWCDKHLYHDAECLYVTSLMNKSKLSSSKNIEEKSKDQSDRDRDPNGSGYSSESEKDTFSSLEPSFDSNYISMDLPGGICSWQDQSSYLSLETPSELMEANVDLSRLDTDISEDTLTNLPLHPVTLPIPIQEPSAEEDGLQKAKDNISNELETLLDEVKIVQANLTDLPNESLQAMERGLEEGISILVKCEEAAILLEQKIMEYRQETEIQALIKELVVIKTRITKLLSQARQGIAVIQEAKSDMEKQKEQIEKETQKIAKLDHWLETINNDLNETAKQSNALVEEDIVKYITIYERYLIEYNEYEIILKSITVINCDDSSQLEKKLIMTRETLEETKHLVISELERLKQLLTQIKSGTETIEEELSQSDRTIDSTSMPEEIVSPREIEKVSEEIKPDQETTTKGKEEKEIAQSHKILEVTTSHNLQTANIETQTGKSLATDSISIADKSIMCQPNVIDTQNVAISCIPLQDVEIQTSENSQNKHTNLLENLQIRQTNTENEQTIEISSKPIPSRSQILDENMVVVNADYKDGDNYKTSQLDISHTIPQSFETIMVEPDETTTEVVVDADGTKRIIVKKIKRSMVTRQHLVDSQNEAVFFDTQNPSQQFSQITLASDKGIVSDADANSKQIQYESYGSHIISGVPDSEVVIQEVTSKPDTIISLEKDLKPDEIFKIAEGQMQPVIETSSSSVTAVVQQVTKRIVKTKRRIIRRVIIVDGKEQVSEEIIEEPDDIEITEEQIPRVSITVRDDKTKDLESTHNDDNSPKILSVTTPKVETSHTDDEKKSSTIVQHQENIVHDSQKTELNSEKKSSVIESQFDADMIITPKEVAPTEIRSSMHDIDSSHLTELSKHATENLSSFDNGTNIQAKVVSSKRQVIRHVKIIDGKEHVTEEIIDQPSTTEILEVPMLALEGKSEIDHTKLPLNSTAQFQVSTEYQRQSIPESLIKTSNVTDIVDNFLASERVVGDSDNKSPKEISGFDLTSNLDRKQVEFIGADTTHIQQMTRTISRTRKRIIQHINIVDGKEHITEEVIEEPEEIEVIKEDPVITQSTASQFSTDDYQGKRLKVIRQIKVVDGKEHVTEKIIDETGDEPIILTSVGDKIEETGNTERPMYTDETDSPKIEIADEYSVQRSETLPVALSQLQKSNVQLIDTNILTSQKVTRKITTTKRRIVKHITIVDGKEHVTEEVIEEPDSVEIVEVPSETENIKVKRVRVVRQVEIIDGKEQVTEKVVEEYDDDESPCQVSIHEIENIEKDITSIDPTKHENIYTNKEITKTVELKDNIKATEEMASKVGVDDIKEATVISDMSMSDYIKKTNVDSNVYKGDNVAYPEENKSDSSMLSPETSPKKNKRSIKTKRTVEKREEFTDPNVAKTVSKDIIIDDTIKPDMLLEAEPSNLITESNKMLEKPKDENITQHPIKLPELHADELQDSVVSTKPVIASDLFSTESRTEDHKIIKSETKVNNEDNNIILSFIDNEKAHSETLILQSPSKSIPKEKYTQLEIKPTVQTKKDKAEDNSDKRRVEFTDPNIAETVSKDIIIDDTIKPDILLEAEPSNLITESNEMLEKPKDESITQHPIKLPELHADELQDSVVSTKPVIASDLFTTESRTEDHKINKSETKVNKEDNNIILSFIDNEKAHSETLILQSPSKPIPKEKYTQSEIKPTVQTKRDNKISDKIEQTVKPETTIDDSVCSEAEKLNVINTSPEVCGNISALIRPYSEKSHEKETENKNSSEHEEDLNNVSKNIVEDIPSTNEPENEETNLDQKIPLEIDETLHVTGTSDLVLKTGIAENIIIESDVFRKTANIDPNLKLDTQTLLEMERQNTNLPYTSEKLNDGIMKCQTVDISMSLAKANENVEPKVQIDLKIEDVGDQKPVIVKKDINIDLPVSVKVSETKSESDNLTKDSKQEYTSDDSSHKKTKKRKKSKKNKDESQSSNSQNIEPIAQSTADNTFVDSDSSTLSHYVELPTPTPENSSKPKGDVTVEPMLEESRQEDSLSLESKPRETEKGYEADDTSIDVEVLPIDKKGKHKKRKPHGESEDTAYPKTTTSESETSKSPVDIKEPQNKDKKSKKGTKKHLSEDPIKQHESTENVTSPKDESCHTFSDTSEVNTVKIVEECVNSSPEIIAKDNVTATLTYPVPVLEEVQIQELSSQTSPELIESKNKENDTNTHVKLVDSELQTSPTPTKETLSQTLPIDDKENSTQTSEDVTVIQTRELLNSEVQTSRIQTPDPIVTSEVMTQIESKDIIPYDDKFSQTATTKEFESEVRETQTSPISNVTYDEKYTEIIIPTADSGTETEKHENVDQQTATSPSEIEIAEISVQTNNVPLVSTHTQSETVDENIVPSPLTNSQIQEIIIAERSQQTSPIESSVSDIKFESAKMIDSEQQTTPRKDTSHNLNENITNENVTLVSNTQQTSPRLLQQSENILEFIKHNTDQNQQTSPRELYEETTSTSTDEPYEVQLRAQISIPQASIDFIKNERESEELSDSLIGDSHKQKRRRQKKKAESPLKSPGSLSDPLNTEISLSVSPTSDDLSSKDISSIDEGISQHASPISHSHHDDKNLALAKLSYSDVVQRSKSKSPSPSKTILTPKSGKAKLLDALEKRTKSTIQTPNISDDTMTVALFEPSVEKSYDLIINKELDVVKNALKTNDSTQVESSVIVIIETISIWLEEIQCKIQTNTLSGIRTQDESVRIKILETYIKNLKEIITVTEIRTEIREEIITLIETLTRQVYAVNNLSNQSNEKVQELENNWNKFISDIDRLYKSIHNVKSSLDNLIMTETTTQQKLEYLDKIETENVENMVMVKKMFNIYKNILESNHKKDCPTRLYTCDDCSRQIENSINTERDRLLQLASLAEEYEQTLQDFGQITDVAEALLDGKIIISNLDHLHEEIQKHRKFFVNLSHCRAILESLEDNLDSETRAKYSSLHHSLHDRATAIIDRAASRAQQMTLAASRWRLLDQGMKEEQQWLRVAQQRIPDATNVTSMDYEQYINLYQSISLDVSQHYAKMLRLISITEGLQGLVTCSGLETDCSLALDTLLKLQEEVDSSLTRLIAFKENWSAYDHLVDRIEGWIKLGNRELETITPENITTTANLRRFWELKAQHEVHNNLKTESGVQFEKALEILPISDEMVQRQFFSNIEDKWRALSQRIGDLHAAAIQNISDRDVSTGEKLYILEDEIRELRSVLDSLKGVIKSDDELNLYIERLQVMSGRIDRIQNELGRLSLLPTAESERLGALLTQSGMLSDQFAEELERSLLLKEKILQVKAGIARCQKSQRRAKLTLEECEAGERLGSDVVERASQTCDKLVEDLSLQWKDILALRQALHTLPTSLRVSVSPLSVEREISALQETHSELESACTDLSVRLRARLQLWRRFERQLELVQGAVREADYMVELLTVQGQVDYDRLLKATEKLETLSESLTRRNGELVGSLRSAAEPLQASCEASVAAQLQRELDDAAATYEHTCANLTTLCDKYQKAVELWKRYRDAAAVVRAFAEQQEGSLHALRPDDAPATAQACLEQEARVAELRSLAARVAAETGSRALQTDADALARRLQLVAGAVQALADLGEARQLARAKAQHAKEKFCDMRQDLTPVHEEGEIVEDKLIALRDNLIALGKSEADIAPAKAELPDIDRDVSDEHSIVRILELWQAMFRDTFLHYHRLSTALVRSGDAATALKLWHEYLLDLQSFLSGSVPADYENLTEHRQLCRVHRNLLASQRSVLMNENKESKNQNLTDKFDTLTNLHNETLARIVERHDEVCTRIATWDDYRSVYTEILQWLKEIEREKEKLQLRYVHIKRIHKTLNKIQNLSDKLPEGRKRLEKLFSNLKKVLIFTEETYGASVRMEYAGIVKRVENLQASLDTWRDFLTRILGLIGEYDNLTSDLQKLYNKSQLEISNYSDDERLSRPQLKKALDRYTELRAKINKTETRLEGLSVVQEQLKECLSPQDIRIVNQKVWQLRQQQADLEHQLSIIIHKIQERLEIYSIFDTRLTRFTEWITKHETRLETCSSSGEVALDPQDLLRRINSDIQAETSLKEREFEWLTQTGNVLIDLSKKDEKSYSKNTSKQLKDVQERWHKLQDTGRSRVTKINELLETIVQLEETLTEIRLKLHTIESQLSTTVVLEQLTTKAVDSKFQARDEIHKCIETESEVVGKNLNLCELVLNDPDVIKGNFDLRNLHTGVDIVDKKWKNICDMSEHRKNTLKEIRKSAELANSLLPKVEKKLDSIEKRVEKIETRKQRGETEDESVSKAVTKDLDNLDGDIKRLEDAYSRIASARGVELRGAAADDAARLRSAVRKHQQLKGRVDAAGADAHRRFIAAHGKAVVALAEADVRLTRALHLAPMPLDKVATLKELDGVERDLAECDALVQEAERLAGGAAAAGGAVSDMRAEYRALYADVRTRLGVARADVVGDVDTAVQVDTLRWETDAELQGDTLTSKETYRVELTTAVQETSEALEALRTILAYEIKDNTSGDELATAAKEVAKAGAKPGQTLELAKHLSELLLTECDATEDEAMLKEVESLSLRYEELLNQAKKRELQINNLRLPHSASYALTCEHESGKITCPLCSERNWKQLDNDLWRLEQWLQYAEATDEARTDPPEHYDALEDAITDHREFLLDLDSHKSLVVSLNVVGSHVTRHARDADAAARAQARLTAANARWDAACARAGAWQTRLQEALVHSRQFHDAVVALVAQLASAERLVRAREPLRLARPAADLRRDFRRFSELRDELSRAEPRVLALRDAAHLLRATDEHDLYTRLGELRLRLQSLRKLSAVYALKLGAALARAPPDCRPASALAAVAAAAAPQLMEEEEEQISTMNLPPLDENDVMPEDSEEQSLSGVRRGLRFVCRVARASLPFQALLLLLLGAAALAPTSHDCRAPPSLAPVLRYPHGPPPL